MAKSDKSESTAEKAPAVTAAQPQQQQVEIDVKQAHACYANFCRVTGTPEELIIDFGLNSQPMGIPTEPIVVTDRLVVNYFTAKRLASALMMALQRHEAAFGVLETDVQKRVRQGALRSPTQS